MDMGSIPSAPIGTGIILPPDTSVGTTCSAPLCSPSVPEVPVGPSAALLSLGNRVYQFSHFIRVPVQGTLYLFYGLAATSSVPLNIDQDVCLRGVSIAVDTADPGNDYLVEILAKTTGAYGVVNTLELPAGEPDAEKLSLVEELAAGTGIGMRIVRTSGSGKSTFRNLTVSLEMRDV